MRTTARWVGGLALAVGCATTATGGSEDAAVPRWASRALPAARGEVGVRPDGTREAVRYPGWPTRDFGAFRTYAHDDRRPAPPVQKATMPAGIAGDSRKGRALFMARAKGPCTGCHLVPGDDVWPAGNVGPDLSSEWCMTPLGTNMLAADAVEYAELELYLTSFDDGKPLSVPGIRH
jgi:hypothetical protein